MQTARLLESLDGDFRRLRELAEGDLSAKVPTCPDWTLADLVEHVAMVYLHKVETMRRNAFPDTWPPDRTVEAPAVLLSRAYAALSGEFASRSADSPAPTWFDPDQTVGFWIRRMAHESVVHRVDGELAAGVESLPIADDIAVDGVDEILKIFLAYSSAAWPDADRTSDGSPTELLAASSCAPRQALPAGDAITGSGGDTVLIRTGGAAWLVTVGPSVVGVADADADPDAATAQTTLSGDPSAMLLWLWRRTDDRSITVDGDGELAAKLYGLLREATQ